MKLLMFVYINISLIAFAPEDLQICFAYCNNPSTFPVILKYSKLYHVLMNTLFVYKL